MAPPRRTVARLPAKSELRERLDAQHTRPAGTDFKQTDFLAHLKGHKSIPNGTIDFTFSVDAGERARAMALIWAEGLQLHVTVMRASRRDAEETDDTPTSA